MDEEASKLSRRSFIKRSSLVMGALGGSAYVAAGSKKVSAHPHNTVLQNYPWNVAVDTRSKITLYLCRSLNVAQLFDRKLIETIVHVRRRAEVPNTDLQTALQSIGCPQQVLKDKLTDTMTNLALYDSANTYTWYCKTSTTSWHPNVHSSVVSLANCMLLPFLYTDRPAVANFLRDYELDLERFTKRRSVRALFTCKQSEIDGIGSVINELQLFREARDLGLLWCKARGSYRISDGVADPLLIPNGMKCSGGSCIAGNPDDYCQEVDGSCNGMST